MLNKRGLAFLRILWLCVPSSSSASSPEDQAEAPAAPGRAEEYEVVIVGGSEEAEGRAESTVERGDLSRRLPRSAPDALRYEPGVFVQQTAHSQGSVYVRGLTGQQTVLIFDGIRLNNSTFRQGPNQYFFTLDSYTLDSIVVLRGGASTRYGSDALGGAVLARPIVPAARSGFRLSPRIFLRGASADEEWGGTHRARCVAFRPACGSGWSGRAENRASGECGRGEKPRGWIFAGSPALC